MNAYKTEAETIEEASEAFKIQVIILSMCLGPKALTLLNLAREAMQKAQVAQMFNEAANTPPAPEPEPEPESPFSDADTIYAYTRAQALEDGFQVDANIGDFAEVTRQHYRTMPVYMTRGVFNAIEKTVKNKNGDYKGIWHDVLWMAGIAMRRSPDADRVYFKVKIGRKNYAMRIEIGPADIDDPRPALTVMLADED